MTTYRFALAGLLALALAACSGKHPPAAATDDPEEDAEATVAAPAPAPAAEPSYDYAKLAEGMHPLLANKPECQRFHDELQAIIDAPAGTPPARDPALIVAEAHDAGCSTKSSQ